MSLKLDALLCETKRVGNRRICINRLLLLFYWAIRVLVVAIAIIRSSSSRVYHYDSLFGPTKRISASLDHLLCYIAIRCVAVYRSVYYRFTHSWFIHFHLVVHIRYLKNLINTKKIKEMKCVIIYANSLPFSNFASMCCAFK